jgi:DNA-binding NtrC family response regulator
MNMKKKKNESRRANTTADIKRRAKNADGYDYPVMVRRYKQSLAKKALAACKGNKSQAARLLKITRVYLYRVLKDL